MQSKPRLATLVALIILWSATITLAQENVAISDPISQTATNIANQFAKVFASKEAKVIDVSGNQVYLNLGERDSITPDMTFEVVEQGRELRDPDTGEVYGRTEQKVAQVKVTTVRAKMSIATVTSKETGKSIAIGNAAFSKSKRLTIAVTNFTTSDGIENALGSAIAEMLIVKLNQVGKFQVIERSQLKKVLEEQKLGIKTLFNNQSNLQKLGKLLGADAILVGTLTDLDAVIDTNVRLISTTTGGVIASASTKIAKTTDVKNKMAQTVAGTSTMPPSVSRPSMRKTRAGGRLTSSLKAGEIFFKEDFLGYNHGDPIDPKGKGWGENVYAFKGKSGKMWLGSFQRGTREIVQKAIFPENWSFKFTASGGSWSNPITILYGTVNGYTPDPGIRFVDSSGAVVFEISLKSAGASIDVSLPGTDWFRVGGGQSLKLEKNGSVFKLFIDGNLIASSYRENVPPITGFHFEAYLGPNAWLTNFVGTVLP